MIRYPLRKKKIVTPSGAIEYGRPEWPMKTIITATARMPVREAISEGSFAGFPRGGRLMSDPSFGTVIENVGIMSAVT